MNKVLVHINEMERSEFNEQVGWIFENSPWVGNRVYDDRPFTTVEQLLQCFADRVNNATEEEQLELLKAHPQLAAKVKMTAASVSEQRGAGLDQLTSEEAAQFIANNETYIQRFGFPFIMAVKGQTKEAIMERMALRLTQGLQQEWETAFHEVNTIASFRLKEWIINREAFYE